MIIQLGEDRTFTVAMNAPELAALNRLVATARLIFEEVPEIDLDEWTVSVGSKLGSAIFELPDAEVVEAMVFPHLHHGDGCPVDDYRAAYGASVAKLRASRNAREAAAK